MAYKQRVVALDGYCIQRFCIGENPNQVYESIKYKDPGERIGRMTVYRLYDRWIKDGRPGEMEFVGLEESEGRVLKVYEVRK